ncbi:MAG: hypothetical protein WBQ76_06615 [Candidatus Korobacteraceae bacterium]
MMDTKHEDLTPAERRYIEHARACESQGVSLLQYYRDNGLSVYTLYNIRRRLIQKGVLPRRRSARIAPGKPGRFIAVRVAGPSSGVTGPICRLRHPSGWVIECASLPDAQWLSALMAGAPA